MPKVVDLINELSKYPGDAQVDGLEWDDDGVYVETAKPKKKKGAAVDKGE